MQNSREFKYKWYLILRIVIVLSIIIPVLLSIINGVKLNIIPYIIILTLTLAMSIGFYFIIRRKGDNPVHFFIQTIFDNILILTVIYYSGGSNSIFDILYFTNIISGSIFLFARGSFTLAVLSTVGYTLISLGEYFGFLVSPYYATLASTPNLQNMIVKLYIYILTFFLLAAVSGFLSERLQKRRDEISRVRLKLKDIINHLPSAIIILDDEFRISDFNNYSKEIFGGIYIGEDFRSANGSIFSALEKDSYYQFKRSGRYFDIRLEKMKYKNMQDNSYILIINDISKLKDFEEKLLMKEKMAVIGELSASIAHEIRNPLSSIKGAVSILDEENTGTGKEHPMFNVILEEIERLNNLITDFLEFSKIRETSLSMIQLKPVIDDVCSIMQVKGVVEIRDINESVMIFADLNRVKQVLYNLLKNSVTAIGGVKDGKIVIEYFREKGFDCLKITDNGPGIDKEIMGKMFRPFNTSSRSGTGLGLAIVYKIVKEEHDGEIVYQSKPGETSFTVKFRRNIEQVSSSGG